MSHQCRPEQAVSDEMVERIIGTGTETEMGGIKIGIGTITESGGPTESASPRRGRRATRGKENQRLRQMTNHCRGSLAELAVAAREVRKTRGGESRYDTLSSTSIAILIEVE
jgi:hypothetical protein